MKQGNGTKARKLNSAIIGVVFIIAGIVALGVQFAPLFADTAKPEPVNYHKACSEDPEPFDSYDNYMPRLVRLSVPAHTLVEVRSAMHDVHSSMADAHQALQEVRRSLHEARSEVQNSLHGVRRDIHDSLRSLPESLAGVFRSLKSAPEHDVEIQVKVRRQRIKQQQRPGSESL